jgi:hypothetical protein
MVALLDESAEEGVDYLIHTLLHVQKGSVEFILAMVF